MVVRQYLSGGGQHDSGTGGGAGSKAAMIEAELTQIELGQDARPKGWWRLMNEFRLYAERDPATQARLQATQSRCFGILADHIARFASSAGVTLPMPPLEVAEIAMAAGDGLEAAYVQGRSSVRPGQALRRIIESGVPVVSNQVQYSLVDRRPEARMAAWCGEHGVTLLAYGTLLGGLLSEKYLGRHEPGRGELTTASLQKYKQMIDAWGGWSLFQELLAALKQIADKHGVGIANVGTRYVLDRPAVAGVIVGARLGIAEHIADNTRTFGFALDAADHAAIEAVLAKSRDLMQLIGDCGDEYR